MVNPPIDYDGVRLALVAAVRQATGLGQNDVVMMEPEEPVAPRSEPPFCGIKITSVAIKTGWDVSQYADLQGDQVGVFTYSGPRGIGATFDFFGLSHEQAYGLAVGFQAGLDQDLIWGQLESAGLAVWRVDQVVDLSALLSTGYEGRAQITVQFGTTAVSYVDVGFIGAVPVRGVVTEDTGESQIIALTADLSGD